LVLFSGARYQGRPEGEVAIAFLVQRGYLVNLFAAFAHPAGPTIAEATALRGELTRRGVKRVIVLVTSSCQSRRAAIRPSAVLPWDRLRIRPAFDPQYNPELWWRDAGSRKPFFSEWTILGSVLIAYPGYLLTR
jgi:hypothetical protein